MFLSLEDKVFTHIMLQLVHFHSVYFLDIFFIYFLTILFPDPFKVIKIFVDKMGEFSWTLLVNSCGQNVHNKSSLSVTFGRHFLGGFLWIFLVNFHGHFFNSNM